MPKRKAEKSTAGTAKKQKENKEKSPIETTDGDNPEDADDSGLLDSSESDLGALGDQEQAGKESEDGEEGKHESSEEEEEVIPEELAEILGEDPSKPKGLNIDLNPKIKSRLKHWAENGLDKSEREGLLQKYKRVQEFEAPKINTAIEAKLPPNAKKRDSFRIEAQNSIGSALMAIGSVASAFMTETESIDVKENFERLFEASKILADAFYQQSVSRKATITPAFDKSTKEILEKAKADEYLFGKDLVDNIKSVKAAEKILANPKPNQKSGPSQNKFLNGPRPVGRRPGQYQQGYPGQFRTRLAFRQNQRFLPRQNTAATKTGAPQTKNLQQKTQ